MKKIMFKDRFGLTKAVLDLFKTMTRRVAYNKPMQYESHVGIVDGYLVLLDGWQIVAKSAYRIGEEVAIAQNYKDAGLPPSFDCLGPFQPNAENHAGWTNKMFVRADLMPHFIRIKSIKAERLQDISDEDCRKEGIIPITWRQWHKQEWNDFSPQRYTDHDVWTLPKFCEGIENPWADSDPDEYMAETAKAAFAVLINKISGKGTWERNPWVFAYEFELIK